MKKYIALPFLIISLAVFGQGTTILDHYQAGLITPYMAGVDYVGSNGPTARAALGLPESATNSQANVVTNTQTGLTLGGTFTGNLVGNADTATLATGLSSNALSQATNAATAAQNAATTTATNFTKSYQITQAQLPGIVVTNDGAGNVNISGSLVAGNGVTGNTILAGTFTGSGAGITNVNLLGATGTLPLASLPTTVLTGTNFCTFQLFGVGDSEMTTNPSASISVPTYMVLSNGWTLTTNSAVGGQSSTAPLFMLEWSRPWWPFFTGKRTLAVMCIGKNDAVSSTYNDATNLSLGTLQNITNDLNKLHYAGYQTVLVTIPYTATNIVAPFAQSEPWRKRVNPVLLSMTNYPGVVSVIDFDKIAPPNTWTNSAGNVNTNVTLDGLHPTNAVNLLLAATINSNVLLSSFATASSFIPLRNNIYAPETNGTGFAVMGANDASPAHSYMGSVSGWMDEESSYNGDLGAGGVNTLGTTFFSQRDAGGFGGWGFRFANNARTLTTMTMDTSDNTVKIRDTNGTAHAVLDVNGDIWTPTNIYAGGNMTVVGTNFGNGTGLTNLNASQLINGTVPLAVLNPVVITNGRSTDMSFSGSTITAANFSGTFTGDGHLITALSASQVTSGTLPAAQLPYVAQGATAALTNLSNGSGAALTGIPLTGLTASTTGSGPIVLSSSSIQTNFEEFQLAITNSLIIYTNLDGVLVTNFNTIGKGQIAYTNWIATAVGAFPVMAVNTNGTIIFLQGQTNNSNISIGINVVTAGSIAIQNGMGMDGNNVTTRNLANGMGGGSGSFKWNNSTQVFQKSSGTVGVTNNLEAAGTITADGGFLSSTMSVQTNTAAYSTIVGPTPAVALATSWTNVYAGRIQLIIDGTLNMAIGGTTTLTFTNLTTVEGHIVAGSTLSIAGTTYFSDKEMLSTGDIIQYTAANTGTATTTLTQTVVKKQ